MGHGVLLTGIAFHARAFRELRFWAHSIPAPNFAKRGEINLNLTEC